MDHLRINRRNLIAGATLAGAGAAFRVRPAQAQATPGIPEMIAEETESALLGPDRPKTKHWRFRIGEGEALLRAVQGKEVQFRVINLLQEEIWLHFFGIRGPTEAITLQVLPGAANAVEVSFTPPDAGTFWFGPFLHAAKQREMGLRGLFLVEEAIATGLVDVPLILDDWKLSDDGVIDPAFGDLNTAIGEGRSGNWYTVNNMFKPVLGLVPGMPLRLRLLNAANSRVFDVQFRGAELTVLSRDGQPIKPQALEGGRLHVAPGERVDLLLKNLEAPVGIGFDLDDDFFEAAQLVPQGKPTTAPPAVIELVANPLPQVPPDAVPRPVGLVIEGGAGGGLQSALVAGTAEDARGLVEKGFAWAMNGAAGINPQPLFEAKPGEVILIEVENRTRFSQVLHVHGHVWHLLEVADKPAEGQSWRDTAEIPADSKAKLVMVAGEAGTWPIQSLVAERADSGLLGAFSVVNMP